MHLVSQVTAHEGGAPRVLPCTPIDNDWQQRQAEKNSQNCLANQKLVEDLRRELERAADDNARLRREMQTRERQCIALQAAAEATEDLRALTARTAHGGVVSLPITRPVSPIKAGERIRWLEAEVRRLETQSREGAAMLGQQTESLQQASGVIEKLRAELKARDEQLHQEHMRARQREQETHAQQEKLTRAHSQLAILRQVRIRGCCH